MIVAARLYRKATEVPAPISVHILGLRVLTDSQPRISSGLPAHRTTGAASSSSTQFCTPGFSHAAMWPPMEMAKSTITSGREM